LRLYTFCHENGHMICYWPDLYDYDGDSRGVGLFCLMCSSASSINPQQPCAYLKMTAGWADVRLLTDYQTDLPVPTTGNLIYKYEHPSLANEFYLIENRQRSGRDLGIPDAGLAIWHVDTQGSNNNQQMTPSSHYLVTLVQADGRWDLEHNVNNGDMTDLWAAPDYPQCTPLTDPDTGWWDGSASELAVMDISTISSTMTFTFNPGAAIHVPGDHATIQAALDAAYPGSIVELDDGLYTGPGNRDLDFGGKAIFLRSGSGEAAACVLDCEGLGRAFHFHSGEGADAVVRDLTIRNGSATGTAAGAGGAAVRCDGASPTFEGCLFQGNTAAGEGGAVRCADSDATFRGCTFLVNMADRGGALYVDGGAPDLDNCTLHGNGADLGGGLYVAAGTVRLSYTIISGSPAGEAAACDAGSVSLDCCDVHGNAGGDDVGCLAGQLGSNGNFSADPLYCNAGAGDFRLDEGSPCAPFGHPEGPQVCGGQQIGALGVGCRSVQLVDATAGPLGDPGAGRSATWGDYDDDGDMDLYVVNDGEANHLLRNDGGAGFVDVTAGPLADAGPGRAAVWGDFDGDSDLDLYLVNNGQANHLLRNEGAGGFVDFTPAALADAGPGRAASWRDFDNDGKLDLYVVQSNTANLLLRNYGEITPGTWFFLSMATAVITDTGPGSAAAWADYDQDGDSDLYLVNLNVPNLLIRNDLSLGFANASGTGVLANSGPGSACAWGDYDNDGRLDLYMVNDGGADLLLRNLGSSFVLVVGQALGDTGHGRAAAWSDYDLDGDLDLILARAGEPDLLLTNRGAGIFTGETLDAALTSGESRGVAWGDVDGDGDPDLYVVGAGSNYLLRNDNESGRHWFHLRLHGDPSNACGVGARVRLVSGGKSQVREAAAEGGPVSLTPGQVAFGLGAATVIDSLVVHWPSGNVQVRLQVAVDIVLDLTEQTGLSDAALPEVTPAVFALHPCYPNPFNPRTTIRYELPEPSRVDLRIYDVAGRLVRILVAAERQPAGTHAATWNGTDGAGRQVAAGLYFCRLEAGTFQATRRLLLLK
jgi:predicted outer membrane repeat protein